MMNLEQFGAKCDAMAAKDSGEYDALRAEAAIDTVMGLDSGAAVKVRAYDRALDREGAEAGDEIDRAFGLR